MLRVQTLTDNKKLPNGRQQFAKTLTPATSSTQQRKPQRTSSNTLPRQTASVRFNAVCKRTYRPVNSQNFDYHLSREETRNFKESSPPMKSVPSEELKLIRGGQRVAYLESRYEHSPETKYNFPEATNWRIGWFHRTNPST